MNAEVAAFKAQVDPILTQLGSDLDNIAADEAGLAKKAADLEAKIDSGAVPLDAESKTVLADLVTTLQARADRTKAIADAVPDAVGPTS